MNTTHIKVIEGTYTGQAFITTDMDDNQITAFHPGAMSESHQNKVSSFCYSWPTHIDGMYVY
jgi:adenosine kinase